MINGIEGVPGSGKSYEATVYHVLAALKSGRKVITNLPLNLEAFGAIDPGYIDLIELRTKPLPVRGTWDAERSEAFEFFGDGRHDVKDRARIFGHVWDFYTDWKNEKGQGPLFVIDECHIALPRIGTDPQVVEWFKLHRHFNVDVLLMTQRFRGVCEDIAALMGMLVKVRKADILGRADHYIRKVMGGYRGGEISVDQRKYRPEFFGLYRSHTQGSSVAEEAATDVMPFLVKFNRIKWVVILVAAVFSVYAFWPRQKVEAVPPWLEQARRENEARLSAKPSPIVDVLPGASSAASSVDPVPELVEVDPEPLGKQQLHLTGWMRLGDRTVRTFTVSAGGARVFDLREADLIKAGYKFEALGECLGVLRWKERARPVLCDAPVFAQGTSTMPVVIDTSGGHSVQAVSPRGAEPWPMAFPMSN